MKTKSEFNWEGLWRTSGNSFILFTIIAYALYGYQPQVAESIDSLVSYYHGHRMRILIAAFISGMAILNLLWFASTLRSTLVDAGRDGWGASVIIASSIFGGLSFLLIAIDTALAFSIADSGNATLISALHNFEWAAFVMSSFPRAMLIMAGSFGLWRAGIISNGMFAAGVTAIVLVLLGGTTWMNEGIWSPDGIYSRFISPIIGLVWVGVVNRILTVSPATRATW